jgi:hypothetical protein
MKNYEVIAITIAEARIKHTAVNINNKAQKSNNSTTQNNNKTKQDSVNRISLHNIKITTTGNINSITRDNSSKSVQTSFFGNPSHHSSIQPKIHSTTQ